MSKLKTQIVRRNEEFCDGHPHFVFVVVLSITVLLGTLVTTPFELVLVLALVC